VQEYLSIEGGHRLEGELRVSGAKNSALPLLVATVLSSGRVSFSNIPALEDIEVLFRILSHLGAEIVYEKNLGKAQIQFKDISQTEPPSSLVKLIRASFWLLGPLLARSSEARLALPGGDAIGVRPVNIHLAGLEAMGARIERDSGILLATAPSGLKACEFELPFPSVGASHHLMMTAALIEGETILRGVAREPEVVELAGLLNQMGARVEGAGSSEVSITGKRELGDAEVEIGGDRIEAATYLYLQATLSLLEDCGAQIEFGSSSGVESIRLSAKSKPRGFSIETAPFPGIATDIQPLLMALAARAQTVSQLSETIFESRFGHVGEFRRFGVDISVESQVASITPVERLRPANAVAGDIRAAAGLVLMALQAEGESAIHDVHHLDRGYENLVPKLSSLGVKLARRVVYEREEVVIGC